MDPQACLARIINTIAEKDYEEAFYACNDMINWLKKGGTVSTLDLEVPLDFFQSLRWCLKRMQV